MMKKILVTGCNGQLGRAIRQEYKGEDVSFINTDVAEGEGIVALDITDVNAVLALVRLHITARQYTGAVLGVCCYGIGNPHIGLCFFLKYPVAFFLV